MVSKTNRKNKDQVEWNESYALGIKMIDDQHKELLRIVNDIFNHASSNQQEEQAYFKEVMKQAVEYIKFHFTTEEKIMITTKYRGYEEHRAHHEEFVRTIIKTARDNEAGKRLTLTSLGYFLKDWVLSHIAVMDKKYCDYFRSIATRKADGKLSLTLADIPNNNT